MQSSITGFAYLTTFFSAGFLTYRFFQYWQKEKTVVSKCFLFYMAVFGIFFLLSAIPALFLANNVAALKFVVISTAFLEGFASAFLGYLIVYLIIPKVSPWFGFFLPFILGVIATVLSVTTPFLPFLEEDLSINWGYQGTAYVFRNLVHITTILPMSVILFKLHRKAEGPYDKARSLGLGMVFVFAIIISIFDYGIEKSLNLRAVSSDIVQVVLSVFLFIFLLLTQKRPREKDENLPPGYYKTIR